MRVIERYLLNNQSCSAKPSELFARVELLKILSDLREALWALAHGSTLGTLLDHEPEKLPGDESLPQSFYKGYYERHLERFRNSVGKDNNKNPELVQWMKDATDVNE